MTDLLSLTPARAAETLAEWLKERGEPAYRVRQIVPRLWRRPVASWHDASDLPAPLRAALEDAFPLPRLSLAAHQVSRDGTEKFLWRLSDGALIESVLIPANPALYGEPSDRHTLYVSTQVGCAYGCKFCASGLAGWKRHLRVEEIVGQVLAVERWNAGEGRGQPGEGGGEEIRSPKSEVRVGTQALPIADQAGGVPPPSPLAQQSRLVSNLVIMGMGEPLANYENLLKALRILNAPWGGGIGARKMTISTSGLAPQIRKLADEPLQFRLAVSLHGATDATRSKIMPVNRKYPLAELMAACEYYQRQKGRMITFEYVLIAGVNDAIAEARALGVLARRLNAKVNLIPYNRVEGLAWERPGEEVQEAFLKVLLKHKVGATLRREKGSDIDAACGQLRLKTERELGERFP